ncbi:hypothetical protein ACVDG5_012475 [Mesorhizobium sp. ORM6]
MSGDAIIPVSLLLYEFATNAAKYGGLSMPGGRVHILCAREHDRIVLDWRESGAAPEPRQRDNEGFGSKLIDATTSQLAADLSKEWRSSGLTIRLSIPTINLAPREA